jgi:deoxyribodipyrimidine photolyase-related protein
MTVLVLGDQLARDHGPLAGVDPGEERVLMIEAREFARRKPYHPHKLTLVFSAMRHFRHALRAVGHAVDYRQCDTFAAGLDAHFDAHPGDDLETMRPASYGAADRLRELVEARGGSLTVADTDLFVTSREDWNDWMGDREPPYRQETFYREARRATGYLMDGDEPLGGEWNYDEENRQFPGADYEAPDPPEFEPDDLTRRTREWVDETFAGDYDTEPPGVGWADPEPFRWPVTREAALEALEDFCEHRLVEFGPYQDAMLSDEPTMNHALLSGAMNVGLLHPREVIERVVDAAKADPDVPLSSLEGFVRQVLGWREFMRHVYRESMPELAGANQLDQREGLPECYWTGDTDMACLSDAVEGVRKRGYSHHIERLMVLSNFALLYGVDPAELNEWFHATYVDAYHWVTTPNVVEMGSFGAGVFATKPYAASANYVDRMSDHCGGCRFDPDATTGADACPFNALYWEFLDRNADELRSNHRMGLVYAHLDDKDEAELEAIRDRAEMVRDRLGAGEL